MITLVTMVFVTMHVQEKDPSSVPAFDLMEFWETVRRIWRTLAFFSTTRVNCTFM